MHKLSKYTGIVLVFTAVIYMDFLPLFLSKKKFVYSSSGLRQVASEVLSNGLRTMAAGFFLLPSKM